MNRLNIPATFFIITGQIPGSQYRSKFIGRPVKDIIEESARIPTGKDNFHERSSAAGHLGFKGTLAYHTRAGALYDADKPEEAYAIIDDLYKKVRQGEFEVETETPDKKNNPAVTWDEIRTFAKQGHEFASHTVTHPYVCALDEVNALYELEKSREDILNQLGLPYTFSAEVPYGSEHEHAMKFAHKVYPALRNRMPEPYMEELNRASRKNPGDFHKEYVQWQRGATTKTPLPVMKSWLDTAAAKDNIWLVLVIHGVDGIGWEALSSEMLDDYFQYMKSKDDSFWIATFADATKYMRERMNATVRSEVRPRKIRVHLNHSLDATWYNLALTLKSYVPSHWKSVAIKQDEDVQTAAVKKDDGGSFILYQGYPNRGEMVLSRK